MSCSPSLLLGLGLRRLPGLSGVFGRGRANLATGKSLASSFQSPASTDVLYPGTTSNDRFSTSLSHLTSSSRTGPHFSGEIPIRELRITYSQSSGPGGQNVNRVATKVDVRFHFDSATWLSDEVKAAVRSRFEPELTRDGHLVVKSDRTRSQLMNQADALRKLRQAIWKALEEAPKNEAPTPEEVEMRRKKKLKAARERVREKRIKSQIKSDKRCQDW